MKTSNFQLTDNSIEIFKKDRQVIKLSYSDINSIQIQEDKKYSSKQFTLMYWTTWATFVFGLFFLMGGLEFVVEAITETMVWGLILSLGLLAYRPIYTMVPKGTFMDIRIKETKIRVPITDIVKDERIHGLINHLKQKIDLNKIKITN